MKLVRKDHQCISDFNTWAKSKRLSNWDRDFSGPFAPFHDAYLKVREYILNIEQEGLSAYTEKPINRNPHIDHFRKKGMFQKLTFDYTNFFCRRAQ